MRIDKRRLYHLDWYLIINGLMLFGVGIFNLISATSSFYSGSFNFIIKQLVAFLIGIGLILIILHFDYRTIAHQSKWLYLGGLLLVVLVLIIGMAAGGAKRWINIFGINIQPSEFMKPIIIIFLANILYERKKYSMKLGVKDIMRPMAAIFIPALLIIKQPDLGTGIIIVLTGFSILWFVGLKKSTYAMLFAFGTISPFIAWMYLMKPYQKMRILSFINIDADPSGFGYHAKQAMIAVGSGRFFGKGYMEGTQHKLQFIPEHHTDFIFTVIGEEWGFFGSIILFLLFASFIWRCIRVAQNAHDEIGAIIAFGIGTMIFLQFSINVMMAIHLAPVVGIPLPFISYGGSSLLTVLASIGLLLNINMRRYMF
ncbi:MAG TPA: rod shape-determining protein RodA [Syntrophorhabdaceae bacterium]|nr:rod shape-determining protein RodA [Syntrophorhabdaceae bacterium]HOT41884.1 rod shape-determining protein RodA [Syntrophorhabdaceae bacterium]HPC66434.1 rod shape-determining protein RodA [Syntrophorhabdaceae bacterium]HQE79820.1 rod shape-determining protein RodA [Syntrophorhabdaceae bacterium]HQH43285.1 rod shape-determining protein RodA [Syntrophorhabdaceae bacterium]